MLNIKMAQRTLGEAEMEIAFLKAKIESMKEDIDELCRVDDQREILLGEDRELLRDFLDRLKEFDGLSRNIRNFLYNRHDELIILLDKLQDMFNQLLKMKFITENPAVVPALNRIANMTSNISSSTGGSLPGPNQRQALVTPQQNNYNTTQIDNYANHPNYPPTQQFEQMNGALHQQNHSNTLCMNAVLQEADSTSNVQSAPSSSLMEMNDTPEQQNRADETESSTDMENSSEMSGSNTSCMSVVSQEADSTSNVQPASSPPLLEQNDTPEQQDETKSSTDLENSSQQEAESTSTVQSAPSPFLLELNDTPEQQNHADETESSADMDNSSQESSSSSSIPQGSNGSGKFTKKVLKAAVLFMVIILFVLPNALAFFGFHPMGDDDGNYTPFICVPSIEFSFGDFPD